MTVHTSQSGEDDAHLTSPSPFVSMVLKADSTFSHQSLRLLASILLLLVLPTQLRTGTKGTCYSY